MKTTLAILNQKGGVGKTTTAINLAAYLAKEGRQVLICDADPQGNTTSGLGIDKNSLDITLYDILMNPSAVDKAIKTTNVKNLYILPANANLAGAEVELVNMPGRELQLKKILDPLDYDYILIDCPPSLGLLSVNALAAASEVLVPVQAEYYAMEGLGQLLATIGQIKQAINPSLNLLGVVITLYDSRTSLSEQVKSELQRHFGDKLFSSMIPRNVRLAEAPSYGRSIHEHDKWSKGARAYKALAKELESRLNG